MRHRKYLYHHIMCKQSDWPIRVQTQTILHENLLWPSRELCSGYVIKQLPSAIIQYNLYKQGKILGTKNL